MPIKKTTSVYLLLALSWLAIAGWQGVEHARFKDGARETLLDGGSEIASTLGMVISQGMFGIVYQPRLEATLKKLVKTYELQAVMLLNSGGQVVASAGQLVDLPLEDLPKQGVRWGENLVTIVNVVDLGSNGQSDSPTSNTTIVVKENDPAFRHERRPPPPGPPPPGPPGPAANDGATSAGRPRESRSGFFRSAQRFAGFRRPPWMQEDQYRQLLEKQGLHGFVLQMPTERYKAKISHDLWIRFTTLAIALLAVGGLGLAWRGTDRIYRLQLRLMQASEMNAHLQGLNIAAAGLAHETRNPLNIVRGLAQLIAQSSEVNGGIRQKAHEIADEVDRVTGRLNEFINYSRSIEPRPVPTRLLAVVDDVKRALESDLAEKSIQYETKGADVLVEADERLLRQILFNLLLNAIQSVGPQGRVVVALGQNGRGDAWFEVRDNGPGVPGELRAEIFKPYFTTRPEGTGMGLAVVRQIVLAHHWEIEYAASLDGGAVFRVRGLKVS